MVKNVEQQIVHKAALGILPLLICLYIVSYLDRVNIGFAALSMNADIGLSASVYGWGAGLFFVGYCLFEVPSNLLMVKFGARRWIARILFTWGAISMCMAFVQGTGSFLLLRFLLGVAEAGFFPAVILYLTLWFPSRYRARIISLFMLSIPVALALGAPLSTLLLELDGLLGLQGWQWLFIIEGLPGVLLVPVVLRYLPDSPGSAKWLTASEKAWIKRELALDEVVQSRQSTCKASVWQVFCDPRVLILCLVYFCATASNLGLSMFLPQIIKQHGFEGMAVGYISAIPYLAGCAGMIVMGVVSDKALKRKVFLSTAFLMIAGGLSGAALFENISLSVLAMSIGTIGIMGCKGPFWALSGSTVSGVGAAASIALINSVGNLGGFLGPGMVGMAKDWSGSFDSGLYLLSGFALFGLVLVAVFVSEGNSAHTELTGQEEREELA
ncbi:MFS transporter [Pseudomonas sp. BW13M1]|uniref:MFS transporter n=1 Tax=Pseudomonas peradeniyensis TaxID=2745488 RepID=A0A923K0P8_9PSED|nr:MFS transporter [Pseudomonas peradeniyensis]MBV4503810.1 MFS transporter [Pseudomonas peradeniyensis]